MPAAGRDRAVSPGRGELWLAALCVVASVVPAATGGPLWTTALFLVLAAGFLLAGLRARRGAAAAPGEHPSVPVRHRAR